MNQQEGAMTVNRRELADDRKKIYLKCPDNTLAFLADGYRFISKRMKKYETDIFVTRILGKKAICITGEEASRLIYHPDLFERNNALPKRIQKSIFGEHAIQTMDGEQHLHRKQLFLSLLTKDQESKLSKIVSKNWEDKAVTWILTDEIILKEEADEVFCKSALEWAGIPCDKNKVKEKAVDFAYLVDSFGGVGARYWKGRAARKRLEKWLENLIHEVRGRKLTVEEGTVLYAMSYYIDLTGQRLSDHMAAIEIINVIRPIIAVSTYLTFAALALYKHPRWKDRLLTKYVLNMDMFLKEVRRFYPFGPVLGAKVKQDFTWKQVQFHKGDMALLDVFGTNRDPRKWEKANRFWPDHFRDWSGNLFDFIPQGGGDPASGHRCPGEGITMSLMKVSIEFLLHTIEYEVPIQDLRVSLVRMPTRPKSGFRMNNIKRKREEEMM